MTIRERLNNLKPASLWFILSLPINVLCFIIVISMNSTKGEIENLVTKAIISPFLQNILFGFYWGFSAVWNENRYQLIGYFFFNIESVIYMFTALTTGSIYENPGEWKDVDDKFPCDPAIRYFAGAYLLCMFMQLCLCCKVFSAMGWKFYNSIGTDIALKKLFRKYQALVVALQIDLQHMILGLSVIYTYALKYDRLIWIPVFITILELIWILTIRKGVISESKAYVISGLLCAITTLIVWQYFFSLFSPFVSNPTSFQIEQAHISQMFYSIMIWRFIAMIMSIVIMCNFSKGLKDRVYPKLKIEPFMGGKYLHTQIQNDELRTRISIQTLRDSEFPSSE
jgi:hypothetical protein